MAGGPTPPGELSRQQAETILRRLAGSGPPPPGGTLLFVPLMDAYVNSDFPSTNFGASALRVDATPDVRTYLRFNVQGVTPPIRRVTLRVLVVVFPWASVSV